MTPSRARVSSCQSWEPRGFSRVAAAFSSYDGDISSVKEGERSHQLSVPGKMAGQGDRERGEDRVRG